MAENNDQEASGAEEKQERLSFGRYLKKARLEKSMTVEDILNQTRISKYVILQIEDENIKNLPETVFLKGFLKAYAETVGVDPDDVIERYKADHEDIEDAGGGGADSFNVGTNGTIKKITGLALVLAGIIIILLLILPGGEKDQVSDEIKTNTKTEVEEMSSEEVGAAESENKITEELLLEIVCVEETTLKINADGGMPVEYKLNPGDHLEQKAKNKYNILIDNTCGVTLFLNSDPVKIPGKCGQTVNIQLP